MNEDDTLPPVPKRSPPDGRLIVFTLLVMLILSALLSGCAAVPMCPDARFSVADSEDGNRYIVLDVANWSRLVANLYGLSEGKCKLPVPGEAV